MTVLQFRSSVCSPATPSRASSFRPLTSSKNSSKQPGFFEESPSSQSVKRSENKDKIETYLAFGATRFEACRPAASEALRLALTPIINQMRYRLSFPSILSPSLPLTQTRAMRYSVIGIISIPGMMTGAILGGSPVDQAAKLQMVIMFMIGASTALASIATTLFALSVGVDADGRIRVDKMRGGLGGVWGLVGTGWRGVKGWWGARRDRRRDEERDVHEEESTEGNRMVPDHNQG